MIGQPTIALFAGETSGDQLGGWLIEALKKQRPGLRFIGVGGRNMQAQGLTSLFPMEELSVIGFTEVLPHALRLKRRIREATAYILREQPDVVVSIDSLGFNFRVNEALRKTGKPLPKFIHYVAPTVWAYKAHRAKKTASLMDAQLTLLPFEPPYFEKEGLRAEFVGHEIAWWWRGKGNGTAFRARHRIAAGTPLLAVFPGSRKAELARLLPIYRDAVAELHSNLPGMEVVIQVPPALATDCIRLTSDWAVPHQAISDPAEKKDLFAAATAALAKSGTIGLECALAGLPSITTYKANPLTAAFVRRLIKTPYVNLANVLLGRPVIPELLQERCAPGPIATALLPLLSDATARDIQKQFLRVIPAMLGADQSRSPSDKAAEVILSYLH